MAVEEFEYSGEEGLRGPLAEALHRVVDPEMALDIVDLGLVYGVRASGCEVDVRVTMTSAACPVSELIMEEIGHEVRHRLGDDVKVEVELVWEPPWTPERMSARARSAMGWD